MNPTHSSTPFVTVVIPTYNRASMLGITLESLIKQNYDTERYEIVVVDNNSTDGTAHVVERYQSSSTVQISYIAEPRQGVHYARNTALRHARGEILYYTDDDMIADRELLAEIVKPFRCDERVAAVTGPVLPKWETEPPQWITKLCRNFLLSLHQREEILLIAPYDCGVISCHQALRRDAFMRSGGFNPENTAGNWIGDGETGLNLKLKSLGYWFAYTAFAITHHMIPPQRMTEAYLNGRLANQGNCDSYTEYREHGFTSFELRRRIVSHTKAMVTEWMEGQMRRCLKKDSWRLNRARASYYRSRIRYDARLIRDEEWRRMVLKSDWLAEA